MLNFVFSCLTKAILIKSISFFKVISIDRIENKILYTQYMAQKEFFQTKWSSMVDRENPLSWNKRRVFGELDSIVRMRAKMPPLLAVVSISRKTLVIVIIILILERGNSSVICLSVMFWLANMPLVIFYFPSLLFFNFYFNCFNHKGNPSMNVPPDDTDSTVNSIPFPNIFVIYKDPQAYPGYLITYS
jgi:hypothetical protein